MTIVRAPRPLGTIPTKDLIVLVHIVRLGISRPRWQVPGVDDLALLRAKLAAREAVAA